MKEIVNRLNENRQIELAKQIMESNGYKVTTKAKRLKESSTYKFGMDYDDEPEETQRFCRQYGLTYQEGEGYPGYAAYLVGSKEAIKDLVTNEFYMSWEDDVEPYLELAESRKPRGKRLKESAEGSEKLPGFKCFVGGKGAYYDDFAGACKLPGDGNIYGIHVDTTEGGDIAICVGGDEEFATKDNSSDRIMISACCQSDAESYGEPENCWVLQMGGAEDLEDAFEIGRSLLSTAKSRGISGINSLCKRLGFDDVMDY